MSEDKCNVCPVRKECPVACEPGSVMCMVKRLQSGKTHGDEPHKRRCPHCGMPI